MADFWAEHPELTAVVPWISPEEKDELARTGEPFTVHSVTAGPSPFRDGDRYSLHIACTLQGAETERLISFEAGIIESRDKVLDLMIEHFAKHPDATIRAKLAKGKNAYFVNPA